MHQRLIFFHIEIANKKTTKGEQFREVNGSDSERERER